MKKFLLYSIYILAVSAFFIYLLFPSDAVKKYIAFKINEANPDYSITIDRIKPDFPPGLKFYGVNLSHKNNPAITAEWMKIAPRLLTLFRPKMAFSFKGRLYEGMTEGEAFITKSDTEKSVVTEVTINANLSALEMKDMHGIQDPSKYKLSGILDGKITYSRKKSDETVDAKLTASGCDIKMLSPISPEMGFLASVFSVDSLAFKSIDADLEIKNNKKIQIKEFVIKGNQISGNISGTVDLKTPWDRSVLNLAGAIRPYPSFLASLGKAATLLFKKPPGENGFPFKIGGTFKRPRPQLSFK